MSETFLRLPDVMARVGLRKTVIYEMIKDGKFPAQLKLGRLSVWTESGIDQWMREKINAPRAAG